MLAPRDAPLADVDDSRHASPRGDRIGRGPRAGREEIHEGGKNRGLGLHLRQQGGQEGLEVKQHGFKDIGRGCREVVEHVRPPSQVLAAKAHEQPVPVPQAGAEGRHRLVVAHEYESVKGHMTTLWAFVLALNGQ